VGPIQRRWRLVLLRRHMARRVLNKRAADRIQFKHMQSSFKEAWPEVASGPRRGVIENNVSANIRR